MSVSIQSSNGITVVTKNGNVDIQGNIKSVSINGRKVQEPNSNPKCKLKRWWKFW